MSAGDWDEATNEEGDDQEEADDDDDDDDEESGIAPGGYGVQRTRRRTNWQHRADALRPTHIRQLRELAAAARDLLFCAAEYVIFGSTVRAYIRGMVLRGFELAYQVVHANRVLRHVLFTASWLYSIARLAWMDYEDFLFYDLTNRDPTGTRYTPFRYNTINELSESTAEHLTGFNKIQLERLYISWRMHDTYTEPGRYLFTGEEIMIYFLTFLRKGHNFLTMAFSVFGGDPRQLTYAIRQMVDHLHGTFYHKISGDSMSFWLPEVDSFREAIWERL
jgi:hypothetical protein